MEAILATLNRRRQINKYLAEVDAILLVLDDLANALEVDGYERAASLVRDGWHTMNDISWLDFTADLVGQESTDVDNTNVVNTGVEVDKEENG